MKYGNKNNTIYNIGKKERILLAELEKEGKTIFSAGDIQRILNCSRNYAYRIAYFLRKKACIERIKAGKYSLLSFSGMKRENVYAEASNIIWPSYISFWTALSIYGFTEQMLKTIFIAATRQKSAVFSEQMKIKFVKLSKDRFFGYEREGKMFIAEKEKAIIDSALIPKYAGGVKEVFKCLCIAWEEIDKEKFVSYILKMKSKTLVQRIGFMAEFGKLQIEKKLLSELERNIGKTYAKLEPNKKMIKKYNNKWKIIINEELRKEEVV